MKPTTAEIKRLETFCRQLTDAIDEFEHELRRCAEAAEREGGASPEHEKCVRKLKQNLSLNTQELEQARKTIEALRKTTPP